MSAPHRTVMACLGILLAAVSSAQQASVSVSPGELIVEPPTLINLAPDLGALEAGQPMPIYGPRPLR